MVILGMFPDRRTRDQTLFRVGRFGDACKRIQDSTIAPIDLEKLAKYKGLISKTLATI